MSAPIPESYVGPSGGVISAGKFRSTPSAARYKTQAESLFYDAPLGVTVSAGLPYTLGRESVANPRESYLWASYGPHRDYVERYSQWAWHNQGGDWLDATGASQGASAAWSFSATAVTSGEHTYSVDMTAALQQAYSLNTWNAWIVRCAQNRMWGTRHHTTPPVLSVTYTDTTSEVLECLASAGMPGGTAYALVGIPTANLWGNNGVLEFARPRKPVLSATMQFTITSHIAGAATVSGFLCNPPKNPGIETTGLSATYLHDDGIAANPDVWFAQSYVDGTTIADYVVENTIQHNHGYMSEWSPDVFGIGAANTSKLPYSWRGIDLTHKFIHGARGTTPPVIVPSSYVGEGFTPVAPGIGALKVVVPGNHAADGAVVGSAGSLGADMWAFLPEPDSGLLDDMYVRYRIMFAPYPREGVAQTKMYRSGVGGTAEYMMPRGKSGVGPQAWSDFGGNNRIGGGNLGWSSRGIYTSPMDMDADTIVFGWHSLDMWYGGDPAGTQGGCVWGGQQDGFGTRLKRGVWYDIETRLKLNTWNTTWDTAPSNDGIFQMWIDGVLVIDFQNFSFRQGPLNYDNPADVNSSVYRGYTPTNVTYHPPFRQLGHVGLWINNYQGGVISCEYDQTVFYANIVASRTRIGPVNTTPLLSAWAPAAGTIASISYAKGTHPTGGKAVLEEISTAYQSWNPDAPAVGPWGGSAFGFNSIKAYGGAVFNPVTRQIVDYAAGHSAINVTAPYCYDLNDRSWKWLAAAIPSDGMKAVRDSGYSSPITFAQTETLYPTQESHPGATEWQYSYDWGDWNGSYSGWPAGFDQAGKIFPEPGHSRSSHCFIPPAAFGNTNGGMLYAAVHGGSLTGANAKGTHLFDFDTGLWRRTANLPTQAGGRAVYDSVSNKILSTQGGSSSYASVIKIFDVATETWLANSAGAAAPYMNTSVDGITFAMFPAARLALMLVTADAGNVQTSSTPTKLMLYAADIDAILSGSFTWSPVTLSNPGATWPTGTNGFYACPAFALCPVNNCLYTINGVNGSTSIWKLTPPVAANQAAYLSGTWTVSEETLGGVALYHRNSAGTTSGTSFIYSRLVWDTGSNSFIWHSDGINGAVQAIRPIGV